MKLLQQIKEDWVNHGRDWTLPGFRAVAIHRFGVWRMGIDSGLIRKPLSFVYRLLYRRARSVYGIELPYTALLGRGVVIEHQNGIVIHGHAKIGDDCIIRQGVTIGLKSARDLESVPRLGNRVDIGAGAQIIGKITIGDDVVIGANAVVVNDVPSGCTVVGIPARPLSRKSGRGRIHDTKVVNVLKDYSAQEDCRIENDAAELIENHG